MRSPLLSGLLLHTERFGVRSIAKVLPNVFHENALVLLIESLSPFLDELELRGITAFWAGHRDEVRELRKTEPLGYISWIHARMTSGRWVLPRRYHKPATTESHEVAYLLWVSSEKVSDWMWPKADKNVIGIESMIESSSHRDLRWSSPLIVMYPAHSWTDLSCNMRYAGHWEAKHEVRHLGLVYIS